MKPHSYTHFHPSPTAIVAHAIDVDLGALCGCAALQLLYLGVLGLNGLAATQGDGNAGRTRE